MCMYCLRGVERTVAATCSCARGFLVGIVRGASEKWHTILVTMGHSRDALCKFVRCNCAAANLAGTAPIADPEAKTEEAEAYAMQAEAKAEAAEAKAEEAVAKAEEAAARKDPNAANFLAAATRAQDNAKRAGETAKRAGETAVMLRRALLNRGVTCLGARERVFRPIVPACGTSVGVTVGAHVWLFDPICAQLWCRLCVALLGL